MRWRPPVKPPATPAARSSSPPKLAASRPAGLPGPPSRRPKQRLRPAPKRKLRVSGSFTVPSPGAAPARTVTVLPRESVADRQRTTRVAQPIPASAPVATSEVAAAAVAEPANALLLRGEFWDVRYAGRSAMLEDSPGLPYISPLLQHAHRESRPLHARELTAVATGQSADGIELEAKDYVLDRVARQQLFDRLAQIAEERDLACAAEDFERAAALDAEHEQIADEHSRHGARGSFNRDSEKARKAVGKAIAETVARIAALPALAPLAEHLASALHKGQWLSYNGSGAWQMVFRPPLPRK